MYVCVCRGVTDRQIVRQVADGARTVRDLKRSLGVASQCGKCGRCAKQVLRDALEQAQGLPMAVPA